MSQNKPNNTMNCLIYSTLVPKGLRPETNEDIESMLDTIGGETYTREKTQRMMQKIKGSHDQPCEEEISMDYLEQETRAHENDLMAMYRDEGESISPDSKQKLDDMRKRACNQDENTGDSEPDDDSEDEE
jgi:hypothetical protein